MDDLVNTAIENTLRMIRANIKADDALKFSQSFLNLVNGMNVLKLDSKKTTKGAGS